MVQITSAVASTLSTIGHMGKVYETLTVISQTDPAEFKQMAVLAESVTRYTMLFIAWCNSMRRLGFDDVQKLWKARHGDFIEKLTTEVGHLAKNTSTVATKALEALRANPALWALENSDIQARINRKWRILVALYFSIELKRCLNTLLWIIIKQDPQSVNALQKQPLLTRPPPLMLRFLYDTLQSGLLSLAEIDHQTWNAVRVRLSTWGIGKFDEPMTLDSLMQQKGAHSLRESIEIGLQCLLYSIGRSNKHNRILKY